MKKILVIAPHADDETLGCGGTILKHNHQGDQCNWLIMTKMSNSSGYSKKQIQKRELEIKKVKKLLSFKNVINFNFETTKLDTIPLSILIKSISEVIKKIKPNILYIPCSSDIHSDHRITSNAVVASSKSFRHNYIKSIREYEVLSETDYMKLAMARGEAMAAPDDANFDAENMCHEIMAGKDKGHETKKIYVSTWQSIYKMQKGYFQQFGMVIGDEAHGFKAKSLTSILTKCTEAGYRYGLTGTLDGTQTHKLVLEGLFGPHKNITTSKELIDRGDLANIKIDILLLKHKEEHCKEVSKMKYQDEVDWIVTSSKRNNFIKNLAIDLKGNTLVLFQYVEKHGEPLFRLINSETDKDRKVFYVSGKTPADTREEIRSITEQESNAILVCSYGTFSTGINIVNLHNIIFASPSKSQIRVLQSIGRGLRKSTLDTTVYDIADDLHWKANKNYTLNHSGERVKIYSKERFKFKIHEVKLL